MQQLITPYVPFPNLFWCSMAIKSAKLTFDIAEHFEKMTYRNKYVITGANGPIQLSVPLQKGRGQRTAMREVLIDNSSNWTKNHLRTINSVYGRAPYFEHFSPELEGIFEKEHIRLVDFNIETIKWVKRNVGLQYEENTVTQYQAEYEHEADIRKSMKSGKIKGALPDSESLYYQLFQERNGFLPNLSVLDILFSEGPAAKEIIKQNAETINNWNV